MPRPTTKRKMSKEGSGDETLPAVQRKARSGSKNTVNFADPDTDTVRETVQTRSSKIRVPKSILKTKSTPLLATPESSKAAYSPYSKASKQPEEEEVDRDEGDITTTFAATAMKMTEDARMKRLQPGLVASHKELASTGTDRENEKIFKEVLLEERELWDTRKRAEAVTAELKQALLANGKLENMVKTLENKVEVLETQVKKSEEQTEKLERELALVREEKANKEKSVREKTAKEGPEAGKDVISSA